MEEWRAFEHGEPKAKPRVVLADDHADVLQEMCELLALEFDVVLAVRQGVELLEAVVRLQPDAVISDIQMPGLSGIDVAREIRCQRLCDAVVLLTVYGEAQIIESALAAGVRGYVLKADAGDELIAAVNSALAGGTYFSRTVRKRLWNRDAL